MSFAELVAVTAEGGGGGGGAAAAVPLAGCPLPSPAREDCFGGGGGFTLGGFGDGRECCELVPLLLPEVVLLPDPALACEFER